MASSDSLAAATLGRLRALLWALFVVSALGTGAELLLLGHTEGFWQSLPLGLLALSLAAAAWWRWGRGPWRERLLRGALVLTAVSGLVGLVQHIRGNVEFELEIYPSLEGWPLFWRALHGATPALAPAAMTVLGLLGLACRYRAANTDAKIKENDL